MAAGWLWGVFFYHYCFLYVFLGGSGGREGGRGAEGGGGECFVQM